MCLTICFLNICFLNESKYKDTVIKEEAISVKINKHDICWSLMGEIFYNNLLPRNNIFDSNAEYVYIVMFHQFDHLISSIVFFINSVILIFVYASTRDFVNHEKCFRSCSGIVNKGDCLDQLQLSFKYYSLAIKDFNPWVHAFSNVSLKICGSTFQKNKYLLP